MKQTYRRNLQQHSQIVSTVTLRLQIPKISLQASQKHNPKTQFGKAVLPGANQLILMVSYAPFTLDLGIWSIHDNNVFL